MNRTEGKIRINSIKSKNRINCKRKKANSKRNKIRELKSKRY